MELLQYVRGWPPRQSRFFVNLALSMFCQPRGWMGALRHYQHQQAQWDAERERQIERDREKIHAMQSMNAKKKKGGKS